MKESAILGVHCGELGWEILRFAPHILWKKIKKHNGNVKLIILTRPDRFDLYGNNADILDPLIIEGDFIKYQSDCFRLTGFPIEQYKKLMDDLEKKYSKEYDVIEKIQPAIENRRYTQKNQYLENQRLYKFEPREKNFNSFKIMIQNEKPCVILGPRYREQAKFRNWNHWNEFYSLLINSGFTKKINFIVCGKYPEYIKPPNEIYDINNFVTEGCSLIGLTIVSIKKSILTIGSQSGIPNLSNLLETPTLQWGNQKHLHTKVFNVKNTDTTFIEDREFNISPEVVFGEMKKLLTKRGIQ